MQLPPSAIATAAGTTGSAVYSSFRMRIQHVAHEVQGRVRTLLRKPAADGPIPVIIPGINRVLASNVTKPNNVQQEDKGQDPPDSKAGGSIHN